MTLPVKVQKSIESDWRGENNLICNECNGKLKQYYICENPIFDETGNQKFRCLGCKHEFFGQMIAVDDGGNIRAEPPLCPKCKEETEVIICNKRYKIGEIKKRMDKDTKIVFLKAEYDTFLNNEIVKEIVVYGEPIPFPMDYLELLDGNSLEVFNNEDRFIPIMNKIKETLFLTHTCLLAKMGYYKKTIPVLIVATARKLLAIPLRDKRLIRPTNQVGSKVLVFNEELDKRLEQFCKDTNIDKYYEFIKLKQKGEVIEVKEKKEVSVPANVDTSILDELIESNNKKKKKVAVEVKE